jgi:eukaryotic-like serine/threonine-protein kinase
VPGLKAEHGARGRSGMLQGRPDRASATPVYGGRYRLGEELGRGGMGRVFVARDLELERSVAIKVLGPGARDAEDDRRLEREARAAGSLAHPNILVVHDIGRGEGGPYIVSELLEGETLRHRLTGKPLPLRKALDFGAQLSRGLAAAHEKGLVHRDIKPENVFITRDGRLKILDFGIARVLAPRVATAAAQDERGRAGPPLTTEPGAIIGTVAYMSPEQVRGRPADHRSDLFSAGVVIYEMLAGRPPFDGSSSIEIASAIVNSEPPQLPARVPPALERLVSRCLEKEPAERFQSARDLAFNLEALQLTETRVPSSRPAHRRSIALAVAVGCVVALAAGSFGLWRLSHPAAPATFRQITFGRGFIGTARFAPDGETVIFSHARGGGAPELFSLRLDKPNAGPIGVHHANLLAVSKTGEMAILLRPQFKGFDYRIGTLGTVPLGGGAVREVAEGVQYADWGLRDDLALVRASGSRTRLEFPSGHVLYETTGWISHPRFSPEGDRIAFIDHPDPSGDDAGSVAIVDLEGTLRTLSAGWRSAQGLAWAPGGREIWFTAAASDAPFAQNVLRAVDLSGKQRVVAQGTGRLKLQDISAGGRVVLTRPDPHLALVVLPAGAAGETDFSWLDLPVLNDLSRDGSAVLLTESVSGAQPAAMFIGKTDGSPPVALGAGQGLAFSPDGKWVLALRTPDGSRRKLALVPTGPGEARIVETGSVAVVSARWLPDGERIVVAGAEPGHSTRLYVQALGGGDPRPISEEGVSKSGIAASPDGTSVAAAGPNEEIALYPIDGSGPKRVRAAEPGEYPVGFGTDGSLFVRRRDDLPAKIFRIDLARDTRSLWKTLMPRDSTAIRVSTIAMTADATSFAYNYFDVNAQLFLLEGIK